jgi:hypothetical protein
VIRSHSRKNGEELASRLERGSILWERNTGLALDQAPKDVDLVLFIEVAVCIILPGVQARQNALELLHIEASTVMSVDDKCKPRRINLLTAPENTTALQRAPFLDSRRVCRNFSLDSSADLKEQFGSIHSGAG